MPRDGEKKWVGDLDTSVILKVPTVARVIQLTPTVAQQEASDCVHKVTHLHVALRRVLPSSTVDAVAWVMWLGKVIAGTSTPAQALNPLSTIQAAWADSDIMGQGMLSVPPIVLVPSTDAVANNDAVIAHYWKVKAQRHYSRVNHGVFLTFGFLGGSESSFQVTAVWRTLLKY